VEGDKLLAVRDDGDLVLMSCTCMLRESVRFGVPRGLLLDQLALEPSSLLPFLHGRGVMFSSAAAADRRRSVSTGLGRLMLLLPVSTIVTLTLLREATPRRRRALSEPRRRSVSTGLGRLMLLLPVSTIVTLTLLREATPRRRRALSEPRRRSVSTGLGRLMLLLPVLTIVALTLLREATPRRRRALSEPRRRDVIARVDSPESSLPRGCFEEEEEEHSAPMCRATGSCCDDQVSTDFFAFFFPFLPSPPSLPADLLAGSRFSTLGFLLAGAFSVAGSSSAGLFAAGFFSALGAIDAVAWVRGGERPGGIRSVDLGMGNFFWL
jgi:hypothetical protein